MSVTKDNSIYEKTSFLSKNNGAFIESMYLKYINSDTELPQGWKEFFDGLGEDKKYILNEIQGPSWAPNKINIKKIIDQEKISTKESSNEFVSSREDYEKEKEQSVKAIALIRAYRIRGHLIANLDPLGLMKREYLNELNPFGHGFKKEDFNKKIYLQEYLDRKYATVEEIITFLKSTYCSTIGAEYMHISDPVEKKWFRERMEKKENQLHFTSSGKKSILNKLIQAESFEKFLAVKFVGTKRFGIDGGESLIPSLEQIIKRGGQLGVKEVKIGMPHRGRLNVLANLLQKSYKRIFNEFVGDYSSAKDSTGDVKYHLGASSNREFDGNLVHISLTDNPSHLEAVNPVVLGQTRAKQFFHKDIKRQKVIPVLIHGDAAFAGQGVVAECFAMSGLKGHNTGGTIHIIVNNQIGFTTSPRFARSSPYPSDVAKMVEAPILHVNGDDPEAVVHCARIAVEFRQKFNRDILIDMICYRRFGHNEGDEPSFTQPIMYQKIKKHPSTLNVYGEKLIKEGTISKEEFINMKINFKNLLDEQFKTAKEYKPKLEWFEGIWSRFKPQRGKDRRGITGVTIEEIKKIGEKITSIPEGFNAHPTIRKIFDNKRKMFESGKGFDWATAEQLAFATLLEEGYPVRLSGQDSGRGTFSQRHSVLRDQKEDNSHYTPLNNISKKQKKFEVIDSLLSELAVLGFEQGYALSEPTTLVVWEAQFGDFANGAQVVIDQFITSGERKWSRASGIVMLLPHGYEGQGPEHSSARLERFLQLCAQENIQVMNCTTPANYFHALRRQIHRDFRKPLIIMTPKSLLRHKYCVSNIEDFTRKNTFHRVLLDYADVGGYGLIKLKKDNKIKKVIICSGKVYFDLLKEREQLKNDEVFIIRIEELYPFPVKTLAKHLKRFKKHANFYWCQEEPQNMGAWNAVRNYIEWTLDYIGSKNLKVSYIGRKAAASPATGYQKKHLAQQKEIIEKVFKH